MAVRLRLHTGPPTCMCSLGGATLLPSVCADVGSTVQRTDAATMATMTATVTRYKHNQDAVYDDGSDQVAIAHSRREAGHHAAGMCSNVLEYYCWDCPALSLSLLSQCASFLLLLPLLTHAPMWMDRCAFRSKAYHSILREETYKWLKRPEYDGFGARAKIPLSNQESARGH